MRNWIMDWWKEVCPIVLISFIYMFTSFILEKLNTWKGHNNRNFLPNIKRAKCLTPRLFVYFNTAWKVSKYGVISGPYLPVIRLNTEIYFVNLRIQSVYRKIGTRNDSIFRHFSRSAIIMKITEYRKTQDNIISNKTIDQMQKCLFHPISEQHSIGGTTLGNDHIGRTYPYHQHRRTRGFQHLLVYFK